MVTPFHPETMIQRSYDSRADRIQGGGAVDSSLLRDGCPMQERRLVKVKAESGMADVAGIERKQLMER